MSEITVREFEQTVARLDAAITAAVKIIDSRSSQFEDVRVEVIKMRVELDALKATAPVADLSTKATVKAHAKTYGPWGVTAAAFVYQLYQLFTQ